MKLKKNELITCPTCGAEYLPAEIYVSKYFLGTVKTIIKDDNGKVVDFDNNSMDLKEEYNCDYCGKNFNVKAKVQFSATLDPVDAMEEEYISSIKQQQFTLDEEEFTK